MLKQKFNLSKIKEKLEQKKEEAESKSNKKKDVKDSVIVKVEAAGEYNFRAFPYLHNKDYLVDPFAERSYHFGIPGNRIFYCPKENDGKQCDICEFVWQRMVEYKGDKEKIDHWRNFLPKRRVWVPGILRGREEEGVKFLCLSTYEKKPGKWHALLNKWLQDAKTYDFMDPSSGFDLILEYESYDEAKSKMFGGAKFGFSGLSLDRERTAIADKDIEKVWDAIEKDLKNVDSEVERYEATTSKDAEELLVTWLKDEKKVRANKNAESDPVDESEDSDSDIDVQDEDMPVNTDEESSSGEESEEQTKADRRARVKSLLKKK